MKVRGKFDFSFCLVLFKIKLKLDIEFGCSGDVKSWNVRRRGGWKFILLLLDWITARRRRRVVLIVFWTRGGRVTGKVRDECEAIRFAGFQR